VGQQSHSAALRGLRGNLTNNGSTLYRYDQANRMISTTLSGATTLFNYNGDGVRLKQVIAGVPTTYTQDLVAPLPVILQAKTGTTATQYLYSLGTRPVGQYASSAWQYLLADGLGSVRQIADASGNVLLTEGYEPYGKLLSSSGSASSIFAYAGEQFANKERCYSRRYFEFAFHDLRQYNNVTQSQRDRYYFISDRLVTLNG
jgi:hypothetical protein